MWYDKIMASFVRPEPRAHQPHFQLAAAAHGVNVYDGDLHLGYIDTRGGYFLDFWQFSPWEESVAVRPGNDPVVVDMHTRRNSIISLPWRHADTILNGGARIPAEAMKPTYEVNGDVFSLTLRGDFADGQRLVYTFRIVFDATWARYRYMLSAESWQSRPEGWEPINFMMVGALHGTAAGRRWSHSVWEDPRGQLRRLVHSNALFSVTDYARYPDGPWRSKNVPLHQCWMAYAANPRHNPAMLVHATNVPMYFATCSQLFDEHLIWQQAGHETIEGNHFHLEMHTEFVDLAPDLAASLLDGAMDPPRPDTWKVKGVALPFRLGAVNDLETPVDVWAPEDCPIILVGDAPADAVAWASDAAHGGSRSIRLRGEHFHRFTEAWPSGAVCNCEPHRRYRFSGWVRTRGVERFARLELSAIEYTFHNKLDVAHSVKLQGDNEWTHLSVELDSGDQEYLMPMMQLYGVGEAWYDDLCLEPV